MKPILTSRFEEALVMAAQLHVPTTEFMALLCGRGSMPVVKTNNGFTAPA